MNVSRRKRKLKKLAAAKNVDSTPALPPIPTLPPPDPAYDKGVRRGQWAGYVLIAIGLVLCLLKITDSVDLFVQNGEFKAFLKHGSPGIITIFAGVLVLLFYKPRVTEHVTYSGGSNPSYTFTRSSRSEHRKQQY